MWGRVSFVILNEVQRNEESRSTSLCKVASTGILHYRSE